MAMDNYTKMALRDFTEKCMRRERELKEMNKKENEVMEKKATNKPDYLKELDEYLDSIEDKDKVIKALKAQVDFLTHLKDSYYKNWCELINKYNELYDLASRLAYYTESREVDTDLSETLKHFYEGEWFGGDR